ncbi:hypothetical protein [Amycolatopsis sp. cmx-4-68]|uniref:YqeB family protein n=1 Tax=Amycolatopsis sp. cmx-4-68 TaxID=2790938 RepID=UPI00397CB3C0
METTVDEPSWLRTASWIGCPLAGGALGVGVWAVAAWGSDLPAFPFQGVFEVVTVSPTRVTLVCGDKTRRIEADLEAVYLDGKELVLRTTDGREIAREKTDLDSPELARAFAEHGYPWQDEPVER